MSVSLLYFVVGRVHLYLCLQEHSRSPCAIQSNPSCSHMGTNLPWLLPTAGLQLRLQGWTCLSSLSLLRRLAIVVSFFLFCLCCFQFTFPSIAFLVLFPLFSHCFNSSFLGFFVESSFILLFLFSPIFLIFSNISTLYHISSFFLVSFTQSLFPTLLLFIIVRGKCVVTHNIKKYIEVFLFLKKLTVSKLALRTWQLPYAGYPSWWNQGFNFITVQQHWPLNYHRACNVHKKCMPPFHFYTNKLL